MCCVDGGSWTRWVHEVRTMEFEGMMKHVPLGRAATVLELGCGDGFQLGLLRKTFDQVFAIDPGHRPASAQGFTFVFAEALPFRDSSFDLVVSNCVLEHVTNRQQTASEVVRVLRPGGYSAHVVPARFWKVASLVLNPIGYPLRVAEKWWAMRQNGHGLSMRTPCRGERQSVPPGAMQVLGRWLYPPIHGTYTSHLTEWRAYGREQWLESLRHPQLSCVADAPLVCATQFGFLRFRFSALRRWLGGRGLHSSWIFVMQKVF